MDYFKEMEDKWRTREAVRQMIELRHTMSKTKFKIYDDLRVDPPGYYPIPVQNDPFYDESSKKVNKWWIKLTAFLKIVKFW